MKLIIALLVLVSNQINAASFDIKLKEILKSPSYYGTDQRVFSDFKILKVEASAESSTTKRSLKRKGCYASKYRNLPRLPFSARYNYTPKFTHKVISAEHDSNKTITIYNFEEVVRNHSEKFDASLPRKCKVTKKAKILVRVEMKEGHEEKYEINLELTEAGFKYVNPVLPVRQADIFGYQDIILSTGDSLNLGFSQTHREF